MINFKDKVVLIVGGSSGIGECCVRKFAECTASVLFCSNDSDNGKRIEMELKHYNVKFIFCDVMIEDNIRSVVQYLNEYYASRLNCLINVVGTHPENGTIDDFSSTDFLNLFVVNVMSQFLFCKFCMPMLRSSRGCIINIASQVASIGQKHGSTYAATKGAIVSLSKSLALDEAAYGVRVNTVSPSIIDTPLLTRNTIDNVKLIGNTTFEEEIERMKSVIPLGSLGSSIDVANACLFLASDMSSFITGTDLQVSGGSENGYGIKC